MYIRVLLIILVIVIAISLCWYSNIFSNVFAILGLGGLLSIDTKQGSNELTNEPNIENTEFSPGDIDKCTVVKILGSGQFAKVYEVLMNNKSYALKREKTLSNEVDLLHEMKIYRVMTSNDKVMKYFARNYVLRVVNCDYVHERKYKTDDNEMENYYSTLDKSPLCLETLMELCDNTLSDYMLQDQEKEKPLVEKYKIAHQLIHASMLVRSLYILQIDIYNENICMVNNNIKFIDYGGYEFYDDIKYMDNPTGAKLMYYWNTNAPLFDIIRVLSLHDSIFTGLVRNKDLADKHISEDIIDILKYIKGNNDSPESYIDERNLDVIWMILDGKNHNKYWENNSSGLKKLKPFIPMDDIEYIIKHFWDPNLILEYLDKKIKSLEHKPKK